VWSQQSAECCEGVAQTNWPPPLQPANEDIGDDYSQPHDMFRKPSSEGGNPFAIPLIVIATRQLGGLHADENDDYERAGNR